MTYTTNNSLEQLESFDEIEMESVQIESSELEGIESLLEENLESIPLESVAEDVEEYMEEDIESRGSSRDVYRRLTKFFTIATRKAVKKITMNPRTRSKLLIACRQGPHRVTQLITPIVAKPLPSYFRFLAFTFCPFIVARLFRSICKEAGFTTQTKQLRTAR